MARALTFAGLALGAALPGNGLAVSQEWTFEARLTTAVGALSDPTPLAPAAEGLLADAALAVKRTDTLDSGLQLSWRGEVRLERDAAARPGFAGVVGACAPTLAVCARLTAPGGIGGLIAPLAPISPTTGLAAFGGPVHRGAFATLENAAVAVSGAWGEGALGFDAGAASRLDARPPRVLESVAASSPGLDPTGLTLARARNDVTGPSFKAVYMTPRLLGIRLGASYTPEADQRGADVDPTFSAPGLGRAGLNNIWEGAASFARNFSASGLRLRAAVTATSASSSGRYAAFGSYQAVGAGLELEKGAWSSGLRWLESDNAWRAGHHGYVAYEAGLVRQGPLWRFGLEAGWAKDQLGRFEGGSFLVGARRKLNAAVDLGLAWSSAEAELPLADLTGFRHINVRNDGLVLEMTVRK